MKRLSVLFIFLCLMLMGCSHDSGSGNSSGPVQPGSQSTNLEKYWYKNTSFYHIWVKSFATGANDNSKSASGTFNGIKANLNYIKNEVGCDGIWLSPIFDCAGTGGSETFNMHGYDTINFENVNSMFGNETDLAALITDCHNNGMKIIFDFVPNHTSDNHEWFKKSCNNDSTYKDWYVWSETGNSLNPCSVNTTNNRGGKNDKNPCEAGGAWFYNKSRGKYYYGAFGDGMPDLNYNNEDVVNKMLEIAKKWLDFGFDGIRVDACQYLVETETQAAGTTGTHNFFKKLRALIDEYEDAPKFMIGETWVENNRSTLDQYFGSSSSPEFNMVFDFDAGRPILSTVQNQADNLGSTLRGNPNTFDGLGYGTFLCNHDVYEDRIGTEFNGDSYSIKLATAMSLMRSTVPFIYYGQEIGMKAPNGGYASTNYSDMEMRYRFDWTEATKQKTQAGSILKLNKALNTLRKDFPQTFACGTMTKLTPNDSKVLAYTINGADGKLLCVFNVSEKSIETVQLTGNSIEGGDYSTLVGDTAASAESSLTNGKAVVKGLAPYAYRVYLMNDSSKENYFDDEVYSEGEEHIATRVYLRGFSDDEWSWTPTEDNHMTRSIEGNSYVWKQNVTVTTGTKEFKLSLSNNDWVTAWGSNSSTAYFAVGTEFIPLSTKDSKNIRVLISTAGEYTVVFNQTVGTVKIVSSSYTEPENVVYMRGVTSWDNNKGIKIPEISAGVYSAVISPSSGGTFSFKFTKNPDNWNKQWGGNSTTGDVLITDGLETSVSTDGSCKNLSYSMTGGSSYLVVLNTTTNKISITKQ